MPSWPTTSLPMTPLVGTLEVTQEPNVVEFKPDVFSSLIRGRRVTGRTFIYSGVLLLPTDAERAALDSFFTDDCQDGAVVFDMSDWIDGELRYYRWAASPSYTHVVREAWRASVQLLKFPSGFIPGT